MVFCEYKNICRIFTCASNISETQNNTIACNKDLYRDKIFNSSYLQRTVTYFTKDMKQVVQETFDVPEQMFTVVVSVLASILALVIFVDRRRQLPKGFAARVGSFRRIRD